LFLDEFPEVGPRVLEVMRQPMEDKVVTIRRAKSSLTFSLGQVSAYRGHESLPTAGGLTNRTLIARAGV
jgi:hypothetical protein